MKIKIFVIFSIFYFASCSPKITKPTSIAELQIVFNILETEKLSNREFPLYSLSIYNDHNAFYNGMNKMMKMGSFKRKLSDEEFENIYKIIQKSKSAYQIYPKEKTKSIAVTNEYVTDKKQIKLEEKKIIEISNLLDSEVQKIINSGNWEEPRVVKSADNQAQVIPNELLLSLKDEKTLDQIVRKMDSYSLKVKKKLSSANNYWLMTFDNSTIKLESIIDLIRIENGVLGVSSNKLLSER